MALVCAICQEVPEEPVVSPVSNHVFERRLIVKHLQVTETDPINNEPLTEDQLIDIKVSPLVKPRPPSATSIPAILKLLQDEWDASMLHTFTMRQQLQTARQELSHALYQHDAACRVIARLTKEVNSARDSLATLKPQTVPVSGDMRPVGESMDTDEAQAMVDDSMNQDILQKLQDTAATLTAERKRRGKKPPEGLATPESISSYQQIASHPGLHSASTPGILTLDVCASDSNKVVTGGADKNVVVFHKESEQILATLKGHTKKINTVVYHNEADIVFSCSPDATIRVWDVANEACGQIIKSHEGNVTGISLHPTGDYLLSSSSDQYWAFIDIASGRVLTKATDQENPSALTCTQFHPDGLIFGTGTDTSVVKIWDLKERSNVANFQGHVGPVTTIAFSENGYYLATAAEDSQVKLWDLRKLRNFKTLTLGEQYQVRSLSFDLSGNYLSVAGTNVQVYLSKQWELLATFTDHTAPVNGVKFGNNASFVTSCGMDRTLKFYSN